MGSKYLLNEQTFGIITIIITPEFTEDPCSLNKGCTAVIQNKSWQTCSAEIQLVHTFGFASHRVSVITTLPWCLESNHRQYVNEWVWLCADKTLFTKQV